MRLVTLSQFAITLIIFAEFAIANDDQWLEYIGLAWSQRPIRVSDEVHPCLSPEWHPQKLPK